MGTSERKCPRCGGVPHITAAKLRARRYTCFDCEKRHVEAWKAANQDKVRANKLAWNKANREHAAAYQLTRYRAGLTSRQQRKPYKEPDPAKNRAHCAVARAIASGRLVKQPCEACGHAKAHAHHDDYGKPLDVRWLCGSCHRKHHNSLHASV